MSSRRKSYTVAEAVITSNPDLDPIVVRFDDQPGRPAQVFDFSEFADFPHLCRHIAAAFNQHCGALRRITRTGQFRCLRHFFVFLREHRASDVKIDDASDLRTELLQEYAAWLQRSNLTIRADRHGTPIRALRVRPVADMALAVEVTSIPATGWRKRLPIFAEQTRAVTIALPGALASSVRPAFFELERRGPTHQRLGPGLSRESDCFWPVSEW